MSDDYVGAGRSRHSRQSSGGGVESESGVMETTWTSDIRHEYGWIVCPTRVDIYEYGGKTEVLQYQIYTEYGYFNKKHPFFENHPFSYIVKNEGFTELPIFGFL